MYAPFNFILMTCFRFLVWTMASHCKKLVKCRQTTSQSCWRRKNFKDSQLRNVRHLLTAVARPETCFGKTFEQKSQLNSRQYRIILAVESMGVATTLLILISGQQKNRQVESCLCATSSMLMVTLQSIYLVTECTPACDIVLCTYLFYGSGLELPRESSIDGFELPTSRQASNKMTELSRITQNDLAARVSQEFSVLMMVRKQHPWQDKTAT